MQVDLYNGCRMGGWVCISGVPNQGHIPPVREFQGVSGSWNHIFEDSHKLGTFIC